MIRRLFVGLVGVIFFSMPAAFLFSVLVPVEEYRQGTWADLRGALVSCATLYGGVAIGVFLAWNRQHKHRRLTSAKAFYAGLVGGLLAVTVVLAGQSLYQLAMGEFAGLGNLWGLIPIFGAVFSALIAGGIAMAWYGIRGSADL